MSNIKDVLDDWYVRVANAQNAHYLSADRFARLGRTLGMCVIVLSAIVGTSVFSTLQNQQGPWFQIPVGLCSMAAVVLAALQTFLGHSERAEKHRIAGAKYGALGRELETLRASADDPSKRPDSSLWFAQGSGSRFLSGTTAIPSTA